MDNELIYTRKRSVASSFMDCTAKLGVAHSVLMLQDNLTECFGMLKADNYRYKDVYNAFWVFTKTKVHFTRRPDWTEEFEASTFPADNVGFRTNINSIFKDKDGNTLITANSECCCLDFEKHRPVKLSNTDFPQDNFPLPVFEDKFEKFDFETTEDDFVYSQQVRCSMIDMSNHLNNTEYVKLGTNVLSANFLQTHEAKDLEVHYLGECKELQLLKIYKKEIDGRIFIRIKEDCRTVFEMCISFYN
ncbi:MAG: thioesterase [Treponema sp.]|uniref:acyl-ACP thioesterase domain-containing protein n=1 Tax=Treponema sp. TaxID=166 RepID=UPI00298DA391|nr:acyl-ACP thioesterase domain-containing protein [Treponema sp.]MCQ2600642.1 thioesterase [Treponema sp.]